MEDQESEGVNVPLKIATRVGSISHRAPYEQ